ncbi:MAG: VOC family protein [Dehalococcoidia bacterium]
MADPIARLGAVTIDVSDIQAAKTFWTSLLGVEIEADHGTLVILAAPEGTAALFLQQVPEPKSGKNRAHPDFGVADLDEATARIEALGGSLLQRQEAGDFHWNVMADPDGNEFCIAATG